MANATKEKQIDNCSSMKVYQNGMLCKSAYEVAVNCLSFFRNMHTVIVVVVVVVIVCYNFFLWLLLHFEKVEFILFHTFVDICVYDWTIFSLLLFVNTHAHNHRQSIFLAKPKMSSIFKWAEKMLHFFSVRYFYFNFSCDVR